MMCRSYNSSVNKSLKRTNGIFRFFSFFLNLFVRRNQIIDPESESIKSTVKEMKEATEKLKQIQLGVNKPMTLDSPTCAKELLKRRREVENCIEEQRLLCRALDEPLRPLSLDPLATELELSEFRQHLVRLKHVKHCRSLDINCLKERIIITCMELDVSYSRSVFE